MISLNQYSFRRKMPHNWTNFLKSRQIAYTTFIIPYYYSMHITLNNDRELTMYMDHILLYIYFQNCVMYFEYFIEEI